MLHARHTLSVRWGQAARQITFVNLLLQETATLLIARLTVPLICINLATLLVSLTKNICLAPLHFY